MNKMKVVLNFRVNGKGDADDDNSIRNVTTVYLVFCACACDVNVIELIFITNLTVEGLLINVQLCENVYKRRSGGH